MAKKKRSKKEDLLKEIKKIIEKSIPKAKEYKDEAGEEIESFRRWVKQNPLIAVGLAFGAGYVVGKTFAKKK
ncbi:MAG: hypothetical protein D6785_15535 [Planctomycetota bacterium]|nr:MAG: hypothetical protein D6785_15535 [Planctomycetota bacterium]